MYPVIRFETKLFDVSLETPNPVNPIRGSSLLTWLKARLPAGATMAEPDAEDWGWYADLRLDGQTYMIGSCLAEDEDSEPEWILQIEKHRSLSDKLLGKNKLRVDDPCLLLLRGLVEAEPAFAKVSVELGA